MGKTLAVLGSGPGIGVGVAARFAVSGFTYIALVARNSDRLKQDEATVLDAIRSSGGNCQVKSWTCDLTDSQQLKRTLAEIEALGELECVLYNAARVAGKPPRDEKVDQIEADFKVRILLIYKGFANPVLRST